MKLDSVWGREREREREKKKKKRGLGFCCVAVVLLLFFFNDNLNHSRLQFDPCLDVVTFGFACVLLLLFKNVMQNYRS